jgi:hypothetical protein
MKYGPTRGELWFRLVFSLAGLGLMGFAVARHGAGGIAWIEVAGLSTLFFGGTAVWTVTKLVKTPRSDD